MINKIVKVQNFIYQELYNRFGSNFRFCILKMYVFKENVKKNCVSQFQNFRQLIQIIKKS